MRNTVVIVLLLVLLGTHKSGLIKASSFSSLLFVPWDTHGETGNCTYVSQPPAKDNGFRGGEGGRRGRGGDNEWRRPINYGTLATRRRQKGSKGGGRRRKSWMRTRSFFIVSWDSKIKKEQLRFHWDLQSLGGFRREEIKRLDQGLQEMPMFSISFGF